MRCLPSDILPLWVTINTLILELVLEVFQTAPGGRKEQMNKVKALSCCVDRVSHTFWGAAVWYGVKLLI